MKKLVALALSALLLAGCTTQTPVPTTGETPPATEEVVITHETLEVHDLPYENIRSAAPMGDDILLHTTTSLVKLDGKQLKELKVLELDAESVQASENGLCCRSGDALIWLNTDLEETHRIALPETAIAVTADLQTVYYTDGSGIRAIDRDTGLDRLLRETTHTGLTLKSLELDDSILVCSVGDSTLFYSAATGQQLGSRTSGLSLTSDGDLWLARISDWDRTQTVFAIGDGPVQTLEFSENADLVPGLGGVLMSVRDEHTLTFRFCDLRRNTETISAAVEGTPGLLRVWGDAAEELLWILLDDGRLVRWDLTKIEEADALSCLAPYYNRENPDTEGLAALEPRISEMEDYYGVKIHIFEDAVTVQPTGMTLVSEYQVDTLTAGLEELELALNRFTPEFLAKAGRASDDGKVHISLVRSAEGNGCGQFWDENGIARIVVTADYDLQADFFHGLAHIIDARVMTECTAFDGWKSLNPKSFSYDYDNTAEHDLSAYPGAFAAPIGMVSPVEDRASIFAHAMLSDMDGIFESDTMQKKLSTLCTGIRKAFGLKDSDEAFSWEQYLAD